MLYDLNWLQTGREFPPLSEIERLKTYKDNRALFKGDMAEVLEPYRHRVMGISQRFRNEFDSADNFELDLNYFQLLTLKTGDMIVGEPPTITVDGGKTLDDVITHTGFNEKLLDAVYDVSRYGDAVLRLKKDVDGKKNFVIVSPDMWFPIVNQEDMSDVLCHVLAWITCINPSENIEGNKRYVLNAQIHYRGRYESYKWAIKDAMRGAVIINASGLNIKTDKFIIGDLISKDNETHTGFKDFAVIPLHNVTTSSSIYGLNDYDRITPLVAELQVRYALESLILDKHSAPTMYAPDSAFVRTKQGEYILPTGGVIPVGDGEQPPGYLTWDASLTANHEMIVRLERHLYSLSEMGAIVNDDAFGASQGFEALETRMTNARLKARRLSSRLTRPIQHLLSELSGIESEKISLYWNDGIPNNEYRETDIAIKKRQAGLFDLKSILIDHFDKSEDDAERIAEAVRVEQSNTLAIFDEEVDDDAEQTEDAETGFRSDSGLRKGAGRS